MNKEFTRLSYLHGKGIIKPREYFTMSMKEYQRNGDTFSMEQVDLFEKQTKEVGVEWKPDISSEEGKIVGVLNQFASGVAEGFTTIGWADDPDNTVEGISQKIGHLVGFAPDIVAGVLSFGASVPISAIRKATGKAGLVTASKTWSHWLEKGAKQVPILSRKDPVSGKFGLRSVPLRIADFVVDNAGARLGSAKLIQTSFLTKGLAKSANFKHVAEESARLGVALAVSARKEGPEGWADAAMHGAMAGAFFGSVGRYVYLGKLLGSGSKAAVKIAEKEIRSTAKTLSDDIAKLQSQIKANPEIGGFGRMTKMEDLLKQEGQLRRNPSIGGKVTGQPRIDSRVEQTGPLSQEGVQLVEFLVKGGMGSAFTGGMATMQRAPVPDQVYEYLLGFFFGAAGRPRGATEANQWLTTKAMPEMVRQASTQYPLMPFIGKNGRVEYKDGGYVDIDYKKIDGYEKLDATAKDYVERWNGHHVEYMFENKMFPNALIRAMKDTIESPAFKKQREQRDDMSWIHKVIESEVDKYRKSMQLDVAETMGILDTMNDMESTDVSGKKPGDFIQAFDLDGLPLQVEVISIKSNGNLVVRGPGKNQNASVLEEGKFSAVNWLNKDVIIEREGKFKGRKIHDLNKEELEDFNIEILASTEQNPKIGISDVRLLNAVGHRLSSLRPTPESIASNKNIVDDPLNLKDSTQVEDVFDSKIDLEQAVGRALNELNLSDTSKQSIRRLARKSYGKQDYFFKIIERLIEENPQYIPDPTDFIERSLVREGKPLDEYTYKYLNKDGVIKTQTINPRQLLQEVFFKEKAMSERKSYSIKIRPPAANNPKKNHWDIEFLEVPEENREGNPLRVDTTTSYWDTRMDSSYKKGFEYIISHEIIERQTYDSRYDIMTTKTDIGKISELNSLSTNQKIYALNLMLSNSPQKRYVSGFNPSNGELITVPFAQDAYKLFPGLKDLNSTNKSLQKIALNELGTLSKLLSGTKEGEGIFTPESLKQLYKQTDKKTEKSGDKDKDDLTINGDSEISSKDNSASIRIMYEKMRLSNFIYAAEMAGYLDPLKMNQMGYKPVTAFVDRGRTYTESKGQTDARVRQYNYMKDAYEKYLKNPLFKDVAKSVKYIKTFYNGVPLTSSMYGKTSMDNGRGKVEPLDSILNKEGGFDSVIINDHTVSTIPDHFSKIDINGNKVTMKDSSTGKDVEFELTDGTKYYSRRLRRRILLDTGRININTPEKEYDAYIKDVILVKENVEADRGLLINKGAEDTATEAMYALMEANGWDVMIYNSGAKSNSRHNKGSISYDSKLDSWKIDTQPEKFTIKPEEIRVIPHEVEVKRDGRAQIHWGLLNKISGDMKPETIAAFKQMIQENAKGVPEYVEKLNDLIPTYERDMLIDGKKLDIDKLSLDFATEVFNNHLHSPLARDILKSLFKSQEIDSFEQTFGTSENSSMDIRSLNAWLEQIDYNPMGLVYGNKAMMFNNALNNILINRLARPMIKRGFSSMRLKGYDAETDAYVKKELNGEGIRQDEFYMYQNDKSRDVEYRINTTTNEIAVSTLSKVYDIWKNTKKDSKYKKQLEEDMMYVITRSPQADEAGIATLKFGGFLNKNGRGIVVHKLTAERLGGADYDGDAVAGYQSIDPRIKQEFRRDKWTKSHLDKEDNLIPLKDLKYKKIFGIVEAKDGKSKNEQVRDIWDPEARYNAGIQAIQGNKDIGLDVNASQTFRRIFDSLKLEGKIVINRALGSHTLELSKDFIKANGGIDGAKKAMILERLSKQNFAFDAMDNIGMKSSEQVSGETFFRYFDIVSIDGNKLIATNKADKTNYLEAILPVKDTVGRDGTKTRDIDFYTIFNSEKNVIKFKSSKKFNVSSPKGEGIIERRGNETILSDTINHAIRMNSNQVFKNLKFKDGKTRMIENFDVLEVDKFKMRVRVQKDRMNPDSFDAEFTINFKNVDSVEYSHTYFEGLEMMATANSAFSGTSKGNTSRSEALLGSEVGSDRMETLGKASKLTEEMFPAVSVQNELASQMENLKSFKLDIFKGIDINRLTNNMITAYSNMKNTPLFKFLVKNKYIDIETDPFMQAASVEGMDGAGRASLFLRAINIRAGEFRKQFPLSRDSSTKSKDQKLYKDIIIASHIRRAQFLVDMSEMYNTLELRLGNQNIPSKEIKRRLGEMMEDAFTGKMVLKTHFLTSKDKGNSTIEPHLKEFLESQYQKAESIRDSNGKLVPLDGPTQEVFQFILHKMLVSDFVAGEKVAKKFEKETTQTIEKKYGVKVNPTTLKNLKKELINSEEVTITGDTFVEEGTHQAKKWGRAYQEKLTELEKKLNEGIDDVELDRMLDDILTNSSVPKEIERIYKGIRKNTSENTNLWNSIHIPIKHKTQIVKEISEFIDSAAGYNANKSKEFVSKIFETADRAAIKKESQRIQDERQEQSRVARVAIEDSIKTDLANTLKQVELKKKTNEEQVDNLDSDPWFVSKRKKEIEILKKEQTELEKDIELKEKDPELYEEHKERLRKKINAKVVEDSTIEYGTEGFIKEMHAIYKQYGRRTAEAVAKKSVKEKFDTITQKEAFSLAKSKPLQTIEDTYDNTAPVVVTARMALEFNKLMDTMNKNPDLAITIDGVWAEFSGQIGWTGVSDIAVPMQKSELTHLEAFNRFIQDMYIEKGSLLTKIKKKIKKYGTGEEEFKKGIDNDKQVPEGLKGIYHLLFNEFVGAKLRTHEMEIYEKRNQPVLNTEGGPIITNRTLTLPTSTLEMVRLMVDHGKTLNTALSGYAEKFITETFEFINAGDDHLKNNFEEIFKAAVRIREFDPYPDGLHKGDGRFANLDLDAESKKYLQDSYNKALDFKDSQRMKEGEIWPHEPGKNGKRKFTILDPDKAGTKKSVDIDDLVDLVNERITNFYDTFKDNFIMKNFTPEYLPDGTIKEWNVNKDTRKSVMDKNDFIDIDKLLARMEIQDYTGANISKMLSNAVGMNEMLWYQYEYGLRKSVEAELGKDVDLSSKEAQLLKLKLREQSPPQVNLVLDKNGRPSAYFNHTGHTRYDSNSPQLELYIQKRLQKFSLELDSEDAVISQGNIHSKLYEAAQLLGGKKPTGYLKPYETWQMARAEMLKERRRVLERGIVQGSREDQGGSDGIAAMIQSRDSRAVFSYMNGPMLTKDALIMPGYDKTYQALNTYHKSFLKTYIDNLVGFRSHMLIDKFESAKKLGEHTNAWSGYMRDALTNMLGLSTFRSLELHGMKKKELPLLKQYIESGLDRTAFSGKLGYEEKRFLDLADAFSTPDAEWIRRQAEVLKDPEMVDDAILQFRSDRLAEFAKSSNVNKIKRFGTAYNVFSDEVVVNTIRKFETSVGKVLGKEDFAFFKDTKGLSEDSKRMALAQRAKAISNFEGKWELLSLLSHPKTLITNMLGGGINIYSDVGIGTFREAMSEKEVVKAFEGSEFEVIVNGVVQKRAIRTMKDVEEWIESLGILDSMFTEEIGMNRDLVKIGNSKFLKELQEQWDMKVAKNPRIKVEEELYKSERKKTLRELTKKYNLFDQVTEFGAHWMQWSERKLRRTAFLAHYLNAKKAFGGEMLRHMTFDNTALIEIAKRGVEGSQFMYHSAFRTNYSNTAMGRIMTRFHPYAWNSIKRRKNIHKYGAKYTAFLSGTAANKKYQRQFTADLMSLALANVFVASIFEYALSPPMSWMQDTAQWVFGDAKDRERAFFSQWPSKYLAPLQIVTPPAARYVLPPINAFLNDDWESFQKYQAWTYLPFGRALRDMTRIYDSPAMAPDFITGIPLHRMHTMRREAVAEKKAIEEAKNTTEPE